MKFDAHKVGLITGFFVALCHAVWSLLVALGLAQGYLTWILGLHFLNNPFRVSGFAISKAVILVAFTFIVGYLVGYLFTLIWNKMVGKK